jgi:hypothetical protein
MMNDTLLLLRILGPKPIYTTDIELIKNLSKEKVYELYLHAKINKIGYTYLRALEDAGIINRYPALENELRKQKEIFNKHVQSIKIISEILTDLGIDHVFIKTIYDFPVLSSDIDVLIYPKLSKKLIEILKSKGFVCFDKGPHFISLHNTLIDQQVPRDKMNYDIDIYDEVSLSYFIYFDKKYCFINSQENSNYNVRVPLPEFELLIQLNHSLFEQLFTLFHLYIFSSLSSQININKLEKISNITESKIPLAITSTILFNITSKVFPNIDSYNLSRLFIDPRYELLAITDLPYRFSLKSIAEALLEKSKNTQYLLSLFEFLQALTSPKKLHHIMTQLIIRRKRITY